jgi:hypothetical protein
MGNLKKYRNGVKVVRPTSKYTPTTLTHSVKENVV